MNIKDFKSKRRSERGFTLIEVLVVLGIMGFALAALYGVLITQQRSYAVQEEISMVQRDARAAMTQLEKDIRIAGFAVPRGSNPVASVQNGEVADPAAPDRVSLNFGVSRITFLTSDIVVQPGNNVQVDSVTGFLAGEQINIVNLENNNLIGTFTINAVDTGTRQISLNGTPAGIGVGSLVVKPFKTVLYSVVTNGVTNRRELHRNDGTVDTVMIDGLTDFQLTYWLDDGTSTATPADLSKIRKIQVSITAETHRDVSEQSDQPRTRQLLTTVVIKNVRV